MNTETENKCKELIHRYFLYKADYKKIETRNKLFILMKDDLIVWVKNILKRWGKFVDKNEVISLTWDCFEFSLQRYDLNKEGSLCKFFFDASRYCLLMKYAKKGKVRLKPEELQEILRLEDSPLNNIFDNLLTLSQFRDCLPSDKERAIWDDACFSLSNDISEKQRTIVPGTKSGTGVEDSAYRKLKRTFINQIKLILNIRDKLN